MMMVFLHGVLHAIPQPLAWQCTPRCTPAIANPTRTRRAAHDDMAEDEEWKAFDPGFDHGTVEVRHANIDGVFSASKISDASGLVRKANIDGQIGDESFDWTSIDLGGRQADLRAANLKGQVLGADNFDWSKVDPNGSFVMKPNLPMNVPPQDLEPKSFARALRD